MRKKSKVTIRDIAAALNISPATVSRALNPDKTDIVDVDKVRLIKSKAREMNFSPNLSAAALRTNKTNIIGVAIPDLLNVIFPPLIKGIQNYLEKHGKTAILINTDNDPEKALKGVNSLILRKVDGLILASAFMEDKSVMEVLKHEIPCVLVARSIAKGHLVHQVLNDEMFGMELAINYLMSLGHTHLAHLEGPQNILQGKNRQEYFKLLCAKNNLKYDNVSCTGTNADYFSMASGQDLMNQYLSESGKATAVIASNDLMAIGAMKAARTKNIEIPAQMSIMGINNMPYSELVSPALTTIAIPHLLLGEHAAHMLLNEIEAPFEKKQRFMISPDLVIRESCAPPT